MPVRDSRSPTVKRFVVLESYGGRGERGTKTEEIAIAYGTDRSAVLVGPARLVTSGNLVVGPLESKRIHCEGYLGAFYYQCIYVSGRSVWL